MLSRHVLYQLIDLFSQVNNKFSRFIMTELCMNIITQYLLCLVCHQKLLKRY